MYYQLTDSFIVPATVDETWAFFSDAGNLPVLTPPWLAFKITTPGDIRLQQDSRIDYTIRWMGLPLTWQTLIVDWKAPTQFADLQIKGPYALWLHHHVFNPVADGVECRDRVIYKLPGGILSPLAHRLGVRKQLLNIFRYRRRAIGAQLGGIKPMQDDVKIERL